MNLGDIERALALLGDRLELLGRGSVRIAVCGGSALMASNQISRQTTKDVDVVATLGPDGSLMSPDPLPEFLVEEVERVARDLDLPADWLNNGPSREPGGLFQLGLPKGFQERLVRKDYGPSLSVCFAGRFDQICFKIYAAVDQGAGRHVDDLREMVPTDEEVLAAARWAMTHDTSDGFRQVLISMLEKLGYGQSAAEL